MAYAKARLTKEISEYKGKLLREEEENEKLTVRVGKLQEKLTASEEEIKKEKGK